jgi:hypothetical protein
MGCLFYPFPECAAAGDHSAGRIRRKAGPNAMLRNHLGLLLVVLVSAAADPVPTPPGGGDTAPATRPAVDPLAETILKQSCEFLAKSPAFAVHAEVWKDEVLPSGHKIQVTRQVDLDLRRPDRLHVDARAHHKGRAIWYDGKHLTVLDREKNLYGIADAPGTIDQTLDLAAETYGITVPLEDMAVSDPFASSMKGVTAGGYFGDESVLGVPCRHVGFTTDQIDWQLWVADGPQPLPQKLVITYKNEPQSPQFTAIFTKWNLNDRVADLAFEFIPPPGSAKIELVPKAPKGKQP